MISHIHDAPLYVYVNTDTFDAIEINIKNQLNEYVTFKTEKSYVNSLSTKRVMKAYIHDPDNYLRRYLQQVISALPGCQGMRNHRHEGDGIVHFLGN